MTMQTTVLTSGGNKLDTDIADQSRRQESQVSSKKESPEYNVEYNVRVPGVLSNIYNSGGQQFHCKSKSVLSSQNTLGRPGLSPTVRKGQEENWVNLGDLTLPLAKQMGAEGTLVKSKSLFGHSGHNHTGKMDPVASNGSKQPRKAGPGRGGPSPEHGPEGKCWNLLKGSGHATAQSTCIRQILMLQLELIEQQQQQLESKNKEIRDLQDEKEMLVARIERMERRLQTVRKDGAASRTPRRREAVEPVLSSEGAIQSYEPCESQTPRQGPFGRSGKTLKRRFLFQDSRMGRSRRRHHSSSPSIENQSNQDEMQLEEKEPEIKSYGLTVVESEELPYLATTEMYLCCWHQSPPSPWRGPSPMKQDNVTVPSWRESIVEPLKDKESPDIPESLDDNVFLKRHLKLELDEKRRKRWDIQRIREQRMFQRLQQRMNKHKVVQECEPELLTFYPEAEDVESIMVTPFLPVVAFGRPLPSLKQENFEIPWLDERSRNQQETFKKKTPHRTCRK